jgi:PleD family two-component response regulator
MRETRNHRSPSAMTAIAPFKAVSISPALWAERMNVGKDDALPVTDSGSGETVLVIDDEPSIRMLMVEILEEAGYLVIEAADGPLKFYSRMSTSTF